MRPQELKNLEQSHSKPWWVYIVQCADNSLYTGISTNVKERIATHNSGKGAKYTKSRRPVFLKISWEYPDRSTASREEARIKKLTRAEKLLLITLA